MSSPANIQKTIEIYEARLAACQVKQQDDDEENEEYWVFPTVTQCLYHQLLGDAYLRMYKGLLVVGGNREKERCAVAEKCMQVLESGMELAGSCLQIIDRKSPSRSDSIGDI